LRSRIQDFNQRAYGQRVDGLHLWRALAVIGAQHLFGMA